MRRKTLFLLLAATSACQTGVFGPTDPDAPTDLAYQLMPSGDPLAPLGILLQWVPPRSGRAVTYDVYSRPRSGEDFGLRATTTSASFHDSGFPQLEYFVQAMDQEGQELGRTAAVAVDERNRLPAPRSLASVTLNRGVQLSWDPNAYDAAPQLFDVYRVYSTSLNASGACDASAWSLEGTTVSDGFVARNLPNGETRCFAVSAISRDGHESLWSNLREDTPRHDARSILLEAADERPATSGFVFAAGGGSFGSVVSDTSSLADIVLTRGADGSLYFESARAEVQLAQYGVSPVSELTSIDRAPSVGYVDRTLVRAGHGYAVRLQQPDGVHFAAIRVVYAGADHVLFDFAYQSQAGNPELLRVAP